MKMNRKERVEKGYELYQEIKTKIYSNVAYLKLIF